MTTDERIEVRNSAIQTIQRIFENCSEQLSPDLWLFCLRVVLFGMVRANLEIQRKNMVRSQSAEHVNDWNDTTRIVLQTISILTRTYMEKLDASQVTDAWSELLEYLQQYLTCGSHALASSVFSTITEVLSHKNNVQNWETRPVVKTVGVWKSYFDSRNKWQESKEENQDAFLTYADAFIAMYRLGHDTIATDIPSMLASLEACIVDSDPVPYSTDIDNMTLFQTRAMECFSMINTENSELPPYLMKLLSRISLLPYESFTEAPEKSGPTFVALSKASMALLQTVTIKHIDEKSIYTSSAFVTVVQSLSVPIREKYKWQREGRSPTLWQRATTSALAILKHAIPHIKSNKEIWTTIVEIAHSITRAQVSLPGNMPSSLERDEQFDEKNFAELRDLITLHLGSTSLPDNLRRSYSRNMFAISLLHAPISEELPDLVGAPLEALYKIRLGQTAEMQTTLRTNMSYVCLSELFDLVSVHDGSPQRIKLAQAAAPYLILRTAIPLKTYIADHPLRGCLPAPESHRRELVFVLEGLGNLKSEPQAIPDAPGVKSKHRKHLQRLYPLLIKASRAARHDAEVFEHIMRLMDMVGDEFELKSE